MKAKELIAMGFPQGPVILKARAAAGTARVSGRSRQQVELILHHMLRDPQHYLNDDIFGNLARALIEAGVQTQPRPQPVQQTERPEKLQYKVWGTDIDEGAHEQMRNACRLPVSVAGALMPDAHVGYGLPIGGVLATDNAVIPYAVGVDIACRMKLTVYERKANTIAGERDRLANIIADETRFGMGCEFKQRRQHEVMDEDWTVSPVTERLRDKAWKQLGTSGSGNH